MTAVEGFASYLKQIHAVAGALSMRQLAVRTGYGKTTIGEAFAGRRLPTWPLVEKLAGALGADVDEVRERWVAARGQQTPVQQAPDWLTSIRADIPEITTGLGFEQACSTVSTDPKRALASSWEALRVCALQLAHAHYGDIPGSWSSNVVETYVRAEKDGLLPTGAAAVANAVHFHHVGSNVRPAEVPSTAELFQIVVLAYRLAWQARDVIVVERQGGENSLVETGSPGDLQLDQSGVLLPSKGKEAAPGATKRLSRALICSIEWVNAPVLPFPTTSVLRKMLDAALQSPELQSLPVHRRDGNGESVLIFDLDVVDSLPPDSSTNIVRALLENLDKLMSDFCRGKRFEVPYPQIRLFSHEDVLTFDGSDYSGVPLEIMASVRKGGSFQDGLAGDFPGVIAIVSDSAYNEEVLKLSLGAFFGEWISLFTTDGTNGLRISFRVPRRSE
ncbi:helix-turn-helix domain-containing protein [Streptomyces canus]|uniref:helix-turn-helix domain-containing protein n=1 Tax=Streptomyces canus TaxID=58343 RepID=UPI0033AF66CA